MGTIRRTSPHQGEIAALTAAVNAIGYQQNHAAQSAAGAIGNGTTNGRLRTTGTATYTVAGVFKTKASTDDLWNLSAQTSLSTGQYKAFHLYLDGSGTATIGAGTVAASEAAALRALPTIPATKSVIGIFVAGPSTNFANALAAQGTIYDGLPSAALPEPGASPDEDAFPITLINA